MTISIPADLYKGGQQLKAEALLRKDACFRESRLHPAFRPDLQYTDEKPADTVTLFIYTGQDASFHLYEDENIQ